MARMSLGNWSRALSTRAAGRKWITAAVTFFAAEQGYRNFTQTSDDEEERNRANVFDIESLASRLVDVTGWLATQPDVALLPVGDYGASTGATLVAAADPRVKIGAVVSRGGRPDLAGRSLTKVAAPTLLIVGGRDDMVLELNRQAQAAISGRCELARDWFVRHLRRPVAQS